MNEQGQMGSGHKMRKRVEDHQHPQDEFSSVLLNLSKLKDAVAGECGLRRYR